MLPAPIAEWLKRHEGVIAEQHDDVTVLFADLVGFTELSASMDPSTLVGLLDEIFSSFDALADAEGLEKIKTIGDAYMVAGGLPTPRVDHAEAVSAGRARHARGGGLDRSPRRPWAALDPHRHRHGAGGRRRDRPSEVHL